MKITDLVIIFIIAFLPISIALDVEQHRQIEAFNWKQVYDEIMTIASEDATIALLEQSGHNSQDQFFDGIYRSAKDIDLNLDKAIDRFYESVYINLGAKDKISQDSLKANLPVQMVVGYDGLYIHTWENVYNSVSGKYETREVWIPKIPYSYHESNNNLVINFTLDEFVYVYDNNTAAKEQGLRAEIASKYPTSIFSSETTFDNVRRQTIIQLIQNQLEFYTNRANYLSQVYGQGYIYNIPYISGETWNNTINDVCFISFLQGLPIPGTNETYSTYGFGGTRLILESKFIGSTYDGVKYFHREGCAHIIDIESTFNSKKEAVKNGYYSCPNCNP
ncbi:MAG TPA: hypothetical protein PLF27_07225 [Sedimentibacter sp.]|nr:hypothetical protein [Sedimentibacter sp.]